MRKFLKNSYQDNSKHMPDSNTFDLQFIKSARVFS
jgi:hypothetical protein